MEPRLLPSRRTPGLQGKPVQQERRGNREGRLNREGFNEDIAPLVLGICATRFGSNLGVLVQGTSIAECAVWRTSEEVCDGADSAGYRNSWLLLVPADRPYFAPVTVNTRPKAEVKC